VLLFVTWLIAKRRGYAVEPFPDWRSAQAICGGIAGLVAVALIFIGIRAGIFTAVESASIAVGYAVLSPHWSTETQVGNILETVRRRPYNGSHSIRNRRSRVVWMAARYLQIPAAAWTF